MDWTVEVIERLKLLWSEGLSTAEIGRRLNISKNAVVGKAHRLALTARPSPIRRDPETAARPRQPVPRRIQGCTLPSFSSAPRHASPPDHAPAAAPHDDRAVGAQRSAAISPTPTPSQARVEAPRHDKRDHEPDAAGTKADAAAMAPDRVLRPVPRAAPARPMPRSNACCWPIGEPGTPDFHFCGAVSVTGRPYCEAHAEIAYVRVRDRRDHAA